MKTKAAKEYRCKPVRNHIEISDPRDVQWFDQHCFSVSDEMRKAAVEDAKRCAPSWKAN